MIHLATILIVSPDDALARDIHERIARNGYLGRIVPSAQEAFAQIKRESPDVVLVGPALPDSDPLDLARALKADPALGNVPVCLLDQETPDRCEAALAAGIDDVLAAPYDDTALIARLRPLVRLSTMNAELLLRAEIARSFGVQAATEAAAPAADCRILVAGAERGDITPVLAGDADLTVTDDFLEIDELVSRKNFDAAILSVGDAVEQCLDLCSQMRNNPRLFNLPVILVAEPGTLAKPEAYRSGVSRLLVRPVDPAQLHAVTLMLVHRQQQRWAMRDALVQTLAAPTRAPQSGAYTAAFLDAYLAHRFAFAAEHGRHLSVLHFEAPTVANIRQEYGTAAADHLQQQLAQWIGGLIRAEDLCAHTGDGVFTVVLADSPRNEAEVVMQRIAGVISRTDFALHDVYRPVKVWVNVGCADMREGDDPASLRARAQAAAA